MNEVQANKVASAIGNWAKAWQSGGNIWLVLIEKKNENLVVISDDCVCEYANWDAYYAGEATSTIDFSINS